MAVILTTVQKARVPGSEKTAVLNFQLSSSYPTGGESLSVGEAGLRKATHAEVSIRQGTESEANPIGWGRFDASTGKVLAFNAKTQKEFANATDLSKVILRIVVSGT